MKIHQSTAGVRLAAILACAGLVGCSHYAKISERRPIFRPVRSTLAAIASAQQSIVKGLAREPHHSREALGDYLEAAAAAESQLAAHPQDDEVRRNYNFAVSRIIGVIKSAGLDPWTQPMHVATATGDFELTRRPDPRPNWNPALYDFTPADQFDVTGTYVTNRTIKDGVGAPLAAVGKGSNKLMKSNFGLPRVYYGVTAVARFQGRRCEIAFEDPLNTETTRLGGRTYPLAADFTVPLAVMLEQTNPAKIEIARMMRPQKYAETARIALLQPYSPDKTVVLVVHGLADSPATWAPMLNALRGDEKIRRNYQFWFYSYPSGYPYPYSAAILRRELDAIEKRYPLRKPMVVVGHSMGGCISRLLVTDVDDKLWMQFFGKPPAQVNLSPEGKKIFEESLIFSHRPEIGRVVFFSAPLRGSSTATNWAGRLASRLVRAPTKLLRAGTELMKAMIPGGDSSAYLKLRKAPNSIDTLAPNNRFVKTINTYPLVSGVPYNVICGDRGKGGNKDHTKPEMADGIVPYWSSHLDCAESELIVPSDHGTHRSPEGIAELRRILRGHIR